MNSEELISKLATYYKKIQNLNNLFEIEEDLKKNTKLWGKYSSIVNLSREMLGSPIHIALNKFNLDSTYTCWTDHGIHHSFSIINIINEINKILKLNLNQPEIFVLLVAAWVHDFGMFSDFPFFSEDQLREYHGRISGKMFLSMDSFLTKTRFNDEEKIAIYFVSAAHQSDFPISILKEPIKVSRLPVRLYLLGSLLRIADALDILSYRASRHFFEYFREFYGRPASSSTFEWNVNNCTISYDISNSCIEYEVKIQKDLKKQLKYLKAADHGIDLKHVNIKPKHFNNYLKHIGEYIPYYIADHILSIENEKVEELEKFLNNFKNFKISIPNTGYEKTISSIMDDRKAHYERLKNINTFSMDSMNIDPEVNKSMTQIRKEICGNKDDNIFMFLFDYENKLLKLWSSSEFYASYAGNHPKYKNDKSGFCRVLQDVSIPLKCGIVGYVAWKGQDEKVIDEEWDLRASYGDSDYLLKLKNIKFINIYDENSLMGVFLFNFYAESAMDNFITNHISNHDKYCWESLLQTHHYFRPLHKQIMKHCITK